MYHFSRKDVILSTDSVLTSNIQPNVYLGGWILEYIFNTDYKDINIGAGRDLRLNPRRPYIHHNYPIWHLRPWGWWLIAFPVYDSVGGWLMSGMFTLTFISKGDGQTMSLSLDCHDLGWVYTWRSSISRQQFGRSIDLVLITIQRKVPPAASLLNAFHFALEYESYNFPTNHFKTVVIKDATNLTWL